MSGYIGTQPVPQATQKRQAFTATAGQTSFATSGYSVGFVDVYMNGVKLAAADYIVLDRPFVSVDGEIAGKAKSMHERSLDVPSTFFKPFTW